MIHVYVFWTFTARGVLNNVEGGSLSKGQSHRDVDRACRKSFNFLHSTVPFIWFLWRLTKIFPDAAKIDYTKRIDSPGRTVPTKESIECCFTFSALQILPVYLIISVYESKIEWNNTLPHEGKWWQQMDAISWLNKNLRWTFRWYLETCAKLLKYYELTNPFAIWKGRWRVNLSLMNVL